MKINFKNNTIEMTKTEANAASKYGSDAYKALKEIRVDFPTYRIVVKATSSKKQNAFKGLTYDYMEAYIEAHDDECKTKMQEFKTLRATDSDLVTSCSYGEIKKWFLNAFPELDSPQKKAAEIMGNIA